MTTLHSGGKFNSKVYDTSGGLHGVGVSVVNALSEHLEVEVARGQKLYRQSYTRGEPDGPLKTLGAGATTGAAPRSASSPTPRSSARARPSSRRGCSAWRAPRPISSAASRSAGRAPRRCSPATAKRRQAPCSTFPGGLKDFLADRIEGQETVTNDVFTGRSEQARRPRRGRMGDRLGRRRATASCSSYCNTVPTPDGGTHEAGLRAALTKGLRAYGELTGNKRAGTAHGGRRARHRRRPALGVHPRAASSRARPRTGWRAPEATSASSRARSRDAFDHWLTGNPDAGQPPARLGDRPRRGTASPQARRRRSAGRRRRARLRLPGKLADCAASGAQGTEIFIVEGDSAGGSAKQARDRATPGRAAAARQDPQRGERQLRQARRQSAARAISSRRSAAARARTTATRTCATRRS